jgi:hypothetical protein
VQITKTSAHPQGTTTLLTGKSERTSAKPRKSVRRRRSVRFATSKLEHITWDWISPEKVMFPKRTRNSNHAHRPVSPHSPLVLVDS